MTSSALFTSVAESTLILEPIRQVGCCSASAMVACATRSRSQVRNGPPDAVRITRDGALPSRGHALQHRAVLRIDRDHLAAARTRRLGDERTRHHQRFLVGERDALAGAECGECGIEAGGTHDCIDHDVDVGMRRGVDQHRRPARIAGVAVAVDETRERGLPRRDLRGEHLVVGTGDECDEVERIAMTIEHPERRDADRPGAAEDGNTA